MNGGRRSLTTMLSRHVEKASKMKPNQWLTAKVNSAGLVTISSQNQHVVFAFLGATCECGLTPATCNLSSVDLKLKKGADALVALQIFVSEVMMTSSFVPFIIHIRWEEEKAIVDLDSGYQSLDGRLGSIDTDGNLIVTAEGQSFVIPGARLPDGSFNQAEVQGLIFRKYRIVEDPAVALGYLLGTVTVMDLEASASLDLRSREARDLRVMKQEL